MYIRIWNNKWNDEHWFLCNSEKKKKNPNKRQTQFQIWITGTEKGTYHTEREVCEHARILRGLDWWVGFDFNWVLIDMVEGSGEVYVAVF